MTVPLTEQQREIAGKNVNLARFMVGKILRTGEARLKRHNHADLDDAAGEAMYTLCRVARIYREEIGPFSTIACCSIGRELRSAKFQRSIEKKHVQDHHGLLNLLPDREEAGDAAQSERLGEVQSALAELPAQRRQAIELTILGGMTLDKAGKVMGISKERVRQHRERGLEMLREALGVEPA